MEDFARKLLAEVDNNYAPHADQLSNQLLTRLPPADARFHELSAFATVLESAQDTCQQNIYNFANGTHGFAKAAEQVSEQYRGSDAFARARLKDVEAALSVAGLIPPTSGGPLPAASSSGSTDAAAFSASPPDPSPPAGAVGSPASSAASSPAPAAASSLAPAAATSPAPAAATSLAPAAASSPAPADGAATSSGTSSSAPAVPPLDPSPAAPAFPESSPWSSPPSTKGAT
ncbi:Duffy receptor gamma form [Actinoplanes sp. SE50]|nr:Duffy receptor gamma form [Actinoplanes sp. SE50/110]ATO87007.1 Duffy receptor gamma form [Actinoplanes sp. SE50]SLM04425.1 hypothetical protein ACSP50_7730 [Actinoplanes sp. SE50/110]